MKNLFFILPFFLAVNFSLNSCDKEKEDLTIKIVGEYNGAYGKPTGGVIDNYTVIVSKVDRNTVRIAPKTGSEFDAWDSDLIKINNSGIGSPSENGNQSEVSLSFLTGGPIVTFSFVRGQVGDMFQGEKN